MTKTFCDRCGTEVTFDAFHNLCIRTKNLNRFDLGTFATNEAYSKILCPSCDDKLVKFLHENTTTINDLK